MPLPLVHRKIEPTQAIFTPKLVESVASPTPRQNQPPTPLLFPSPTARTELNYWTKRSIVITLSPRKLTHTQMATHKRSIQNRKQNKNTQ